MVNKTIDIYVKHLVRLVEAEENLWKSSHYLYGNLEIEQASWQSVARKLNIMCKTDIITVENVKSTWKSAKESYEDCKQFKTARIFPLFPSLRFSDETLGTLRSSLDDYDGLFSRKKGNYLLLLHIMVYILFLGPGAHVATSNFLTKEDKLCYGEYIRNFILMSILPSFLCLLVTPPMVQLSEQTNGYEMIYVNSVIVFVPTVILLILFFTGNDCRASLPIDHNALFVFPNSNQLLVLIYLLTAISQILVLFNHLLKLHRPPTIIEMSSLLTLQAFFALSFILALLTSQWTEFYLVLLAWIIADSLILLSYYFICWKHSKTLYKFQKRCRVVAMQFPSNDYEIRFELEE